MMLTALFRRTRDVDYRLLRAFSTQSSPFNGLGVDLSVRGIVEEIEGAREAATEPRDRPAGPLYESHVPLTPLQKAGVALYAAVGALSNPRRADLVSALGETTGMPALRAMRRAMQATEEGRAVLAERPRITNETLERCRAMDRGSFGAAYADFMDRRGFEADERPIVRFVDDDELAYVSQRNREVHDLWHVLFNCKTTVLGELALKAVEFSQTGLPMAFLSVAGAQFRLSPPDRALLWSTYLPWASRAGLRAAPLMSIYYEAHFHRELEQVRAEWRIEEAPTIARRVPPGQLLT